MGIMQQCACLAINTLIVYSYGCFNCTTVDHLRLNDGPDVKIKSVGWCLMAVFGCPIVFADPKDRVFLFKSQL